MFYRNDLYIPHLDPSVVRVLPILSQFPFSRGDHLPAPTVAFMAHQQRPQRYIELAYSIRKLYPSILIIGPNFQSQSQCEVAIEINLRLSFSISLHAAPLRTQHVRRLWEIAIWLAGSVNPDVTHSGRGAGHGGRGAKPIEHNWFLMGLRGGAGGTSTLAHQHRNS